MIAGALERSRRREYIRSDFEENAVLDRRRLLLTGLILPLGFAAGSAQARTMSIKVLGDEEAPVEILEFSSLTCPVCARFRAETLPEIKSRYVDTGAAKFVYRDFPLDLRAWLASAVAHCAGDDGFFPFLDGLYAEQARWVGAPTTRAERQRLEASGLPQSWADAGRTREEVEGLMSVAGNVNALVDLAQFVGLATDDTYACLADFELLDWILESQREGIERFQVQATPTFVIAGRPVASFMTVDEMAREIEAALPAD